MILSTRMRRIYLAQHRVDFRKQHDGLLAEAFRMKLNPYHGDVLIFVGRTRNRIKVLYADETGLWVSAKRFTMGTLKTRLRFLSEPSCTVLTSGELGMLIEGSRYTLQRKVTPYCAAPVLTGEASGSISARESFSFPANREREEEKRSGGPEIPRAQGESGATPERAGTRGDPGLGEE